MEHSKHLSYARSIHPSIAIFYWFDSDGKRHPLEIQTTKVSGQFENSDKVYEKNGEIKEKVVSSSDLSKANLHTVDACIVPGEAESLECKFSLRIEANILSPDRTDNPKLEKSISAFVEAYKNKEGFKYLASRYLHNVYQGTWLWRNQNTLQTDIFINNYKGNEYCFENVHIKRFDDEGWGGEKEQIELIENEIAEAFINPRKYCALEVTAKIKHAFAQEIVPSQVFINKKVKNNEEKDKNPKDENSRVYQTTMSDEKKAAIFSSVKVGAAISMIDDWLEDADNSLRVGAFGVDKNRDTAHRHPNTGNDFYSVLARVDMITEELITCELVGEKLPNDAHYLAAMLIKGGLFIH